MEKMGGSRSVRFAGHQYAPGSADRGEGEKSSAETCKSDDFRRSEKETEIKTETGRRKNYLEEFQRESSKGKQKGSCERQETGKSDH